jgi:hypothetical protein
LLSSARLKIKCWQESEREREKEENDAALLIHVVFDDVILLLLLLLLKKKLFFHPHVLLKRSITNQIYGRKKGNLFPSSCY